MAFNTIYLCMYIFIVLIEYQGWSFQTLSSVSAPVLNITVLLSSPNKKFVLSRSFLNFLTISCKLKVQFLENFAPPPGIRPSFFASGAGN